MAGAAHHRDAVDRRGRRTQARRPLRPRPGAAARLAPDRNREPVGRHRRHGQRARRLPQIHPGRSREDAGPRRHRTAPGRLDQAADGVVRRHRRIHRPVGAARRPDRPAAVELSRRDVARGCQPRRHHRQVHRRRRDGVLGRAREQRRSRRRRLPGGAGLPARAAGVRACRRRRPAAAGCGSASTPATCWSAISGRNCGSITP